MIIWDFFYAEITDKQLKNSDDFVWAIEVPLTGKFIVDIEFLDLKISSPNVRLLICYLCCPVLFLPRMNVITNC